MTYLPRPEVAVHLPPDTSGLPAAVEQNIEEFVRLQAEHHQAQTKLDQLERSRANVEQRDADDAAVALRAGKGVTGQRHLEAHIAEVAKTRHHALALVTALDASARDLIAAIEAEKPGIVAHADEEVQAAESTYADAVAALDHAHQHMVAARSQRSWATSFPGRSKGAAPGAIEVGAMNGAPLAVGEVLARLREVVAVAQ